MKHDIVSLFWIQFNAWTGLVLCQMRINTRPNRQLANRSKSSMPHQRRRQADVPRINREELGMILERIDADTFTSEAAPDRKCSHPHLSYSVSLAVRLLPSDVVGPPPPSPLPDWNVFVCWVPTGFLATKLVRFLVVRIAWGIFYASFSEGSNPSGPQDAPTRCPHARSLTN